MTTEEYVFSDKDFVDNKRILTVSFWLETSSSSATFVRKITKKNIFIETKP
jgi:hypothetical protein